MGCAPASGAVFCALAVGPRAPKSFERLWQFRAQTPGREARPATPEAGVLPDFGIQFNRKFRFCALCGSPNCGFKDDPALESLSLVPPCASGIP